MSRLAFLCVLNTNKTSDHARCVCGSKERPRPSPSKRARWGNMQKNSGVRPRGPNVPGAGEDSDTKATKGGGMKEGSAQASPGRAALCVPHSCAFRRLKMSRKHAERGYIRRHKERKSKQQKLNLQMCFKLSEIQQSLDLSCYHPGSFGVRCLVLVISAVNMSDFSPTWWEWMEIRLEKLHSNVSFQKPQPSCFR